MSHLPAITADTLNKAIRSCMRQTGYKREQVSSLTWEDFPFDSQYIYWLNPEHDIPRSSKEIEYHHVPNHSLPNTTSSFGKPMMLRERLSSPSSCKIQDQFGH